MIDEFSATSPNCSVEAQAPIQANQVNSPCFPGPEHPYGTARGFPVVDPLTGILDDLLARRDRFFCEHAKPFDPGSATPELSSSETPDRFTAMRVEPASRSRWTWSRKASWALPSFKGPVRSTMVAGPALRRLMYMEISLRNHS
jgi:hypothetical protein